jgi:hypothetical protein
MHAKQYWSGDTSNTVRHSANSFQLIHSFTAAHCLVEEETGRKEEKIF